MRKQLLITAAIAAATGTGAYAADLVIDEDPVAVVDSASYDWDGFYAGVHGGFVSGSDFSVFDILPVGPPLATITPNLGLNGLLVGAQVGVDHQMGAFVLGAEGRISFTNLTGNNGPIGFPPVLGLIDTVTGKFEASILGRAGYAIDRFLPYVTAGVSALNFDRSITSPVVGGQTSTANATALGVSVGAGGKFAVNENIVLFGEYLHTWYGTTTLTLPTAVGPGGFTGETVQDTITTDKIVVGANWRF